MGAVALYHQQNNLFSSSYTFCFSHVFYFQEQVAVQNNYIQVKHTIKL